MLYQALHLAKALPFTDKAMKMDALFVNLNEILAESAEQYCCLKKVVFIHLAVGYARSFDRIEIKRMFHVKHYFFRLF